MKYLGLISVAGAMICAGVTATGGDLSDTVGSASALPLYTAFKTFCVDTGAVPQAVNAAVKNAGGKPHDPAGGSTEDGTLPGAPFPMTLSNWVVTVSGHHMLVNSGTSLPSRQYPFAKFPPHDFDSCDIQSFENEDASVTAIQKWVGMPPVRMAAPSDADEYSPDLAQYHYVYQVVGSERMPMKDKELVEAAEVEGRYWSLVLLSDPRGAAVHYMHILPKPSSAPTSSKNSP